MRPSLAAALAAALLLGAPRAGAQTSDTAPDTVVVEAVTVTAARVALPTEAAPARVTVLQARDAERAGARSVAELLDARAPVSVRRYGPSGLASLSLRGAGAAQTLVVLDGHRLGDPQLGQVDLRLLPTALLGSVELLHGAAGGLWGADAVGGVVHLRTPRPERPAARLATEAGAWGERRLGALGAARLGALRALVAAEAAGGDGDYAVEDRTRLGAPRVRRQGWDHGQASLVASLAAGTDADGAGASVWLADAERGLGGATVGGAVVGARQWDRRGQLTLRGARRLGGVALAASGAAGRARLRYASGAGALDETGRTATVSGELRVSGAHRGWDLAAALSAGTGRADHPSLSGGARDGRLGLAVSAASPGRVRLFPALRADVYAPAGGPRETVVSPHLGLNAALGRGWRAKGSLGRAVRMPTLNDRFWVPGGQFGLRPERAVAADAGVVASAPGRSAEVSAFWRGARDLIVWVPDAQGVWSPENVARTRTVGLEAAAQGTRAARLAGLAALADGGAALTLTSARDLDAGTALRYVPAWTARTWSGLGARLGATDLRLDLGVRAEGARPVTASQRLAAYAVADLRLAAERAVGGARLGLAVLVDNLTDARYQSVQSYVMPPRALRVRLTLASL